MAYPVDDKPYAIWSLLKEVILISSVFKEEYSIELLKVPNDFKKIKIGNLFSIDELILQEELEIENKQLIYDFLANRTISNLDEIDEEIFEQLENKKANWIELKYDNQESQLLLGSFLLILPTISFRTHNQFEVDDLSCEFSIEYQDNTVNKVVTVKNFYDSSTLKDGNAAVFLIGIKKDIQFGRGEWNPISNPIWNKKTEDLIKEMGFPQSIDGKKDKIYELKDVGKKIAELNSWIFDSSVTKLNKNSGQLRMIFVSESQKKKSYLSIDMKNAYGRFEHHNAKGKHIGEIDFETGKYVPRNGSEKGQDTTGGHDIKIRK